MRAVCRELNVTVEQLLRNRPHLEDEARPHVEALRGLDYDAAQRYAIANPTLSGYGLHVALALLAEEENAETRRNAPASGVPSVS